MRTCVRALVSATLGGLLSSAVNAGVVTPELQQHLSALSPRDDVPVIIKLADRVDPTPYAVRDRRQRNNALLRALRDKADRTQGPVATALGTLGGQRARKLWLINGIALTVPSGVVKPIAALPGVASVQLDSTVQLPVSAQATAAPTEWNIAAVHAPDLWSMGYTGAGVVVANMDTGVDSAHPDLAATWRGGANSWYDPHGQHAAPYDASGHGTQTMGLMVGGNAGGTSIGLAPGARWIAVKLFNDAGQATLSDIHASFQWLMDPDGNLATLDSPDVVNASWSLIGGAIGSCNLEFNDDIHMLKAAGIAVVFAAGNDGPAAFSSDSPGNNPEGFSAGSVNSALTVANDSSRGPSGCDNGVFPRLVAPGVNVRTTDLSFGGIPLYAIVSGTSFAAPHVAGAMALLAGAFPGASVAQIETALMQSAQDLGTTGADNSYGYGLVNVYAAYGMMGGTAGHPPTITSQPVTAATEASPYNYNVIATDPDGDALAFSLDTAPSGMTIGPANGAISWTPASAQTGANAVAVRVTDTGGLSATQSFSVTVAPINHAPVAANDAYRVVQGSTLTVAAPGVLANDLDADNNPLSAALVAGVAHGSLTLNSGGGFSYTPIGNFTGTDSFSYAATDGQLTSNVATVTLTVAANKPPVAANDSFTAPVRTTSSYVPRLLAVLANDTDSDGTINVATVTIVSQPNKGGTATVNSNGTVSYTPKRSFTGNESFSYRVRDDRGAQSNTATVAVSVR